MARQQFFYLLEIDDEVENEVFYNTKQIVDHIEEQGLVNGDEDVQVLKVKLHKVIKPIIERKITIPEDTE